MVLHPRNCIVKKACELYEENITKPTGSQQCLPRPISTENISIQCRNKYRKGANWETVDKSRQRAESCKETKTAASKHYSNQEN